MKKVRRNALANVIGRGWTAVVYLAAVPAYIHLMGIEAYGLVGVFFVLQAISAIADLGLGTTLNRELARTSAEPSAPAQESRDMVRTLELVYWTMAAVIGGVIVAVAPLAAERWIQPERLAADTVTNAVTLMGLVLMVQWPLNFYAAGLMGLQRHLLLNVINIVLVTVRVGGAIVALLLLDPTIEVFFGWQLVATVLHAVAAATALWAALPASEARARFRRPLLARVRRFAAGIAAIAVVSIPLTQMDKIVVSRLPLETFGYYNVATAVATGLYFLTVSIFNAVFPDLSATVEAESQHVVARRYHESCQLMAVAMLPVAAVIAAFSPEILRAWTGDEQTVSEAHLLTTLLVTATALHGLMNVPYALQLAAGWTGLAFYQNLIALVVFVPVILWATDRWGAVGAAATWLGLNVGYVALGIQAMHMRLLKSEKLRWYGQDVALPLAAAAGVALLARWLIPLPTSSAAAAAVIVVVLAISVGCTAIVTPLTRDWLLGRFMSPRAVTD